MKRFLKMTGFCLVASTLVTWPAHASDTQWWLMNAASGQIICRRPPIPSLQSPATLVEDEKARHSNSFDVVIIDNGDEVFVKAPDGGGWWFYRNEQACRAALAVRSASKPTEQRALDPYR